MEGRGSGIFQGLRPVRPLFLYFNVWIPDRPPCRELCTGPGLFFRFLSLSSFGRLPCMHSSLLQRAVFMGDEEEECSIAKRRRLGDWESEERCYLVQ